MLSGDHGGLSNCSKPDSLSIPFVKDHQVVWYSSAMHCPLYEGRQVVRYSHSQLMVGEGRGDSPAPASRIDAPPSLRALLAAMTNSIVRSAVYRLGEDSPSSPNLIQCIYRDQQTVMREYEVHISPLGFEVEGRDARMPLLHLGLAREDLLARSLVRLVLEWGDSCFSTIVRWTSGDRDSRRIYH